MSRCAAVVIAVVTVVAVEAAGADSSIPEAQTGRNIIVNRSPAYLSLPTSEVGGGPGVIVLPGEGEVNDDVRRVIDRFAAAGFIAIAVTAGGEETLDTIAQAATMLRERAILRAGRVAIVGSGESARWAWRAATGAANVNAVVTYDVAAPAELGGAQVPHLALAGIAARDEAAAADAWQRMVDFLSEHVGPVKRQPTSAWTAPFGVPGISPEQTAEAPTRER